MGYYRKGLLTLFTIFRPLPARLRTFMAAHNNYSTMDCRLTLNEHETFLAMLTACVQEKREVALLVDDNGLARASGHIQYLHTDGASSYIELEKSQKIAVSNIVAVNGVFASAYAEC